MRPCITGVLVLLTAVVAMAQLTAVPAETLQKMTGLSVLQGCLEWHRNLSEYEAEFVLRAYNPAQNRYHNDEFAVWLNRPTARVSQLAIRTEVYGVSYTASPASAEWWDDNTPVTIPLPANPLAPNAPWMGPFGDSAAGMLTLDPNYPITELWSRDRVRSIRISQGVHTFQIRDRNNNPETLNYPYWQLDIQTERYTVVVRVGKENPVLLYYSKAKDGRVFWEETWYPIRWR